MTDTSDDDQVRHPSLPRPKAAVIAAATVTVVGSVLVWFTFDRIGSSVFLLLALGVALAWFVGAALVQRRIPEPPATPNLSSGRTAIWSLLVGLGTGVFFFAGTAILLQIPVLRGFVLEVAVGAQIVPLGLTVLVAFVTGLGEESFFRGALPRLWPGRRGWAPSLALYTISVIPSGNLALLAAAPMLGLVCQIAIQHTGRVWSAMVVHGMWTLIVVGGVPTFLV